MFLFCEVKIIPNGKSIKVDAYQRMVNVKPNRYFVNFFLNCEGDYDILKPLHEFLKNPIETDLETILSDCLEEWRIAVKNDYESQQEDEYISEHLIANEYEFTEEGERY